MLSVNRSLMGQDDQRARSLLEPHLPVDKRNLYVIASDALRVQLNYHCPFLT